MNVLIIGGTGTISTSITDLLQTLGHGVTVFNRGLRRARYKQPPAILRGDKKDSAAFKNAVSKRPFDAVIDMISYNPDDAAITLDAFAGRDVHFVFTSTVAAYKRPFAGLPITETFALQDKEEVFPYGYHKARMEAFLMEKAAEGLKVTIIRPSLTYGIGSKNIGVLRNNYGIIRRIQQQKPIIVFGDGTNPWAFTFAPDIAKAYAGVLCREACFGQAYHATSDDVRIWDDLYLIFGKIVGEQPKLLHMSTEMLNAAAPENMLHVYQEKMFAGVFDNTKIKRDVPAFMCEYTLDKLLEAIYDWYMADDEARLINEDLDRLEDSLAEKYYACMDILRG